LHNFWFNRYIIDFMVTGLFVAPRNVVIPYFEGGRWWIMARRFKLTRSLFFHHHLPTHHHCFVSYESPCYHETSVPSSCFHYAMVESDHVYNGLHSCFWYDMNFRRDKLVIRDSQSPVSVSYISNNDFYSWISCLITSIISYDGK
jgi:hypothetical protein